ncbi:MAG: NAD(P)-dependent oxidoreductase [Nitrospira sp.]|nr:NAD(P)-dependent oxidoreductase [Nitrospira sp.]
MNIAFLGAGLMGRPMAERLKAAGHAIAVFNRTRDKVADLAKAGITVAERPEEAVRAAFCVILMLADAKAIRTVLLSSTVRQELKGRTVIQMGTVGPRESQAIQRDVQAAGGDYLEAPVLGSIAEVQAGKLLVMVGGTPEQFTNWADLFRCFGPEPRLIGQVGQAAALKLALNQLIAAEIAAFSLSLGLVQREGIPVDTFMAILKQSALFAPAFEKKLPRLLTRDYANPNFSTKHLLKDVELFLKEAGALGLCTSSLEGAHTLLTKTIERGLADIDYSALYEAVNPGP